MAEEPGVDANTVLVIVVLAAACAAAVWWHTGRRQPEPSPAERRRLTSWSAALVVVTALIMEAAARGAFWAPRHLGLVLLVVTALVLFLQPRLSLGLLPVGLIALGGILLAAARRPILHMVQVKAFAVPSPKRVQPQSIISAAHPATGMAVTGGSRVMVVPTGPGASEKITLVPGQGMHVVSQLQSSVSLGGLHVPSIWALLPLAYGLLVLGGWLAWRALDRRSPVVQRALGELGYRAHPARSLILLLVVVMAGELLAPGLWTGANGLGLLAALLLLGGTAWFIRRSPAKAAITTTVGIFALGLASLTMPAAWRPGGEILDGIVLVIGQVTAYFAVAQAVALIGFALWLTPRTIPLAGRLLGWEPDADLARRVVGLTESRAVAVDTAAADLRRLERDLHDGAQARLVALGMSLRTIERLIPVSPDAAIALVAEARETSARALTELRELVRGVHPPVLADRGLGDAIRALALDTPLDIETDIDLPGRLPAPIETACYFAVAEVLTNAAKHSGARHGRISVTHAERMLRIVVTDFGVGGADPARGSGLAGVERRLAAFDGIVAVSSPVGGPTLVVLEVPCALSSPRISSY
jgi:signal transduction histidine kinase